MVVLLFLIWAHYSPIEEVVTSPGEVIPSTPVRQVQHLEGGIVAEILVAEGDMVPAGGVLVRFDPAPLLAEKDQYLAKLAGLEARKARLEAFAEERPAVFNREGAYSALVPGQEALLQARIVALRSQGEILKSQSEASVSRLRSLKLQVQSVQDRIALLDEDLRLREQGLEKGLVSRISVLAARQERERTQGEVARLKGEIDKENKVLEETGARLRSLTDDARRESLAELDGVQLEWVQVREAMNRIEEKLGRMEVRSPVSGVIQSLATRTVGGVVPPGGEIAHIVPVDETRLVEIRISPADVGHVAVGQTVTVKVLTYDFARYGGIPGVLTAISPTTFQEEGVEPYYKGRIRLMRSHVDRLPSASVWPGMTVQADVNIGSKTLLEYLLKPIYASSAGAFREQ
ncbi:MAG: HlyD family type I secretion periplasmic adaptor subunit [Magnetococcales bacterium]|nr:HlyD family type I secretion periplasmic adaptor subunit [Magnetococcales bacterium]